MRIGLQIGSTKPVEKWTNRDFLTYFSDRLFQLDHKGLTIPPVAWQGFHGRIKNFRNKLNLSNRRYKDFIDSVFDKMFIGSNKIPAFGAIVSEKVFHYVGSAKQEEVSSEYVEKLKKDLLSNPAFAKELQEQAEAREK